MQSAYLFLENVLKNDIKMLTQAKSFFINKI